MAFDRLLTSIIQMVNFITAAEVRARYYCWMKKKPENTSQRVLAENFKRFGLGNDRLN